MATNSTPPPLLKKKKLSKKYQLKNVSVNQKNQTIASYKINIRKAVDPNRIVYLL